MLLSSILRIMKVDGYLAQYTIDDFGNTDPKTKNRLNRPSDENDDGATFEEGAPTPASPLWNAQRSGKQRRREKPPSSSSGNDSPSSQRSSLISIDASKLSKKGRRRGGVASNVVDEAWLQVRVALTPCYATFVCDVVASIRCLRSGSFGSWTWQRSCGFDTPLVRTGRH